MTTLREGAATARACLDEMDAFRRVQMYCAGPDITDDGDGETDRLDALREELDAAPEPPWWGEPFGGEVLRGPDEDNEGEGTQEIVVKPMPGPAEPYDAADDTAGPWLTLAQHEQLDVLAAIPGVEVRGASVWVPRENLPEAWLSMASAMVAWETVFVPGCWFSFAAA